MRYKLRLKYSVLVVLAVLVAMAAGAAFAFIVMAGNGTANPGATTGGVKPTELASAVVAAAALIIAGSTWFYNWRKTRNELFLKIYDQLMALDVQEGRRLLHARVDPKAPLEINDNDEYAKINRSVALIDVMGMYAYRGLIPKAWILEEWGRTLAHAKAKILHFADNRKTAPGLWPHMRRLLDDAEVWAERDRQRADERKSGS